MTETPVSATIRQRHESSIRYDYVGSFTPHVSRVPADGVTCHVAAYDVTCHVAASHNSWLMTAG